MLTAEDPEAAERCCEPPVGCCCAVKCGLVMRSISPPAGAPAFVSAAAGAMCRMRLPAAPDG